MFDVTAAADNGWQGKIIGTNEMDYRVRAVNGLEIYPQLAYVLRVDNNPLTSIADYWLGVFPEGAEIVSPYFVRTPKVQPLEIGAHGSTVRLDLRPGTPAEAWYSATLQGTDYRVSLELTRSDGKSNAEGGVRAFGSMGEELKGVRNICTIIENSSSGSCTSKLSLADETKVLFRLMPSNAGAYRMVFNVMPISE